MLVLGSSLVFQNHPISIVIFRWQETTAGGNRAPVSHDVHVIVRRLRGSAPAQPDGSPLTTAHAGTPESWARAIAASVLTYRHRTSPTPFNGDLRAKAGSPKTRALHICSGFLVAGEGFEPSTFGL